MRLHSVTAPLFGILLLTKLMGLKAKQLSLHKQELWISGTNSVYLISFYNLDCLLN